MDLALNNLKRVDMPLNKETKPNQTLTINDTSKYSVYPTLNLIIIFTQDIELSNLLVNLPTPSHGQDYDTKCIFERGLTGLK